MVIERTGATQMSAEVDGLMIIMVDGNRMSFEAFLAAHLYVDKEWRRDIEFDLGFSGCHVPSDEKVPWAHYSRI
jgi:hypothetical protein